MSHRKCVEIRIMLEKFHILGAVGIESEDGAETSWGVRVGGVGRHWGNPTTPSKRPR